MFVADFFLEDGYHGGAEQFNNNLINELSSEFNITKARARDLDVNTIDNHEECFFIISNFMELSEHSKLRLQGKEYIILEHDHKYVSNNDPSKFINMIAPQGSIQNKRFYEKAKAVLCQSKIHSEVLQKNLLIDSVINLSCNLWSDEQLELLQRHSRAEKTTEFSIIDSNNKNKGTPAAVKYCEKNNIKFNRLGWMEYEQFIRELSKTKTLIFFPQWLESFNRLVVEAKILCCEILTNKLVGVASEEWFIKSKPSEIIPTIKKKREEVLNIFRDLINGSDHNFFQPPIYIPKVSIITSLYSGGEFIEGFMESITNQTAFDRCELIILDAASPDDEFETCIKKYMQKFENIKYTRFDRRLTVQETMNFGIEISEGEFITLANVDDTRHPDHIKILASSLVVDPSVDLVYADCYEVSDLDRSFKPDYTKKYEHSISEFSKQNMIKCLPGPMPLWRKSIHQKCGKFNEELKFAGDWDFWLRAVRQGSRFKKIQEVLGLYYNNPGGLSTSEENASDRFEEERRIFNTNKDIFGDAMTSRFEGYFNGR